MVGCWLSWSVPTLKLWSWCIHCFIVLWQHCWLVGLSRGGQLQIRALGHATGPSSGGPIAQVNICELLGRPLQGRSIRGWLTISYSGSSLALLSVESGARLLGMYLAMVARWNFLKRPRGTTLAGFQSLCLILYNTSATFSFTSHRSVQDLVLQMFARHISSRQIPDYVSWLEDRLVLVLHCIPADLLSFLFF